MNLTSAHVTYFIRMWLLQEQANNSMLCITEYQLICTDYLSKILEVRVAFNFLQRQYILDKIILWKEQKYLHTHSLPMRCSS